LKIEFSFLKFDFIFEVVYFTSPAMHLPKRWNKPKRNQTEL